jgi:hypothetical protein
MNFLLPPTSSPLVTKVNYEKNGSSDHFVDPKLPVKSFSNHHYSFGEPLNIDRNIIQGKTKRFVASFPL